MVYFIYLHLAGPMLIEGSLEAKLSDNIDRWKNTAKKKLRHGENQKGEDKRWRKSERENVRREKMQVREKVGKSQKKRCVFLMFCGSGGSKSRLAKAAGAEPVHLSSCSISSFEMYKSLILQTHTTHYFHTSGF